MSTRLQEQSDEGAGERQALQGEARSAESSHGRDGAQSPADDDLTLPRFLDSRAQQRGQDFVENVARLGGGSIEFGDVKVVIPASDRTVTTEHNEGGPELPLQAPAGKSRNRPGGMNVGRLPAFIDRIEKLEEERTEIGSDIRDVYSEAKGAGYDIKTIRALVRLRRMDAADRAEQETLLDTYKHALGMV